MEREVVLKTHNISKTFGPTKALVNVDLEVYKGEVHGLIGENGSGKSTLSTIVAAVQKADSGEMFLGGQLYNPQSVIEANELGVSMIVQEQNTIGGLSVASNIFAGRESQFIEHGLLNLKKMNQVSKDILNKLGVHHIDPNELIEFLPFEDRKIVELARALYTNPKILIIDETTTALTIKGREILYSTMHKMREEGGCVLFISHDIDEIMDKCDSLTVLRDGILISTLEKKEFEVNKIRQLMVGREIAANLYRTDNICSCCDEIALEAKNVFYGLLKDVSLQLKKGEILGIGGLTDCGMHDLGKILFGLIKPDEGKVLTGKGVLIKNPITAIKNEIGYVSKDRDKESLMPIGSICDNVCSASWNNLASGGLIPKKTENEFANQWAETLNIKMVNIDQFCTELSGGNKQKVVLAKWLGKNSEVFIFDCPTRGIDVGVKASIYKLMAQLKNEGKSIVMISEELTEVIGMSDRILILKEGKITGEFKRDELLTEERLIDYMI